MQMMNAQHENELEQTVLVAEKAPRIIMVSLIVWKKTAIHRCWQTKLKVVLTPQMLRIHWNRLHSQLSQQKLRANK